MVLQCSRKISVALCKTEKQKTNTSNCLKIVRYQYYTKQCRTERDEHKTRLMEKTVLQNLKKYVEMQLTHLQENQKRTCLQIKSCVGHNLLKTIIALAVVL